MKTQHHEYIEDVVRTLASSSDAYTIVILGGIAFAVFENEHALVEYYAANAGHFDQCRVCCMGAHMNAFDLGPMQ